VEPLIKKNRLIEISSTIALNCDNYRLKIYVPNGRLFSQILLQNCQESREKCEYLGSNVVGNFVSNGFELHEKILPERLKVKHLISLINFYAKMN
jgi:hypothetical protein